MRGHPIRKRGRFQSGGGGSLRCRAKLAFRTRAPTTLGALPRSNRRTNQAARQASVNRTRSTMKSVAGVRARPRTCEPGAPRSARTRGLASCTRTLAAPMDRMAGARLRGAGQDNTSRFASHPNTRSRSCPGTARVGLYTGRLLESLARAPGQPNEPPGKRGRSSARCFAAKLWFLAYCF